MPHSTRHRNAYPPAQTIDKCSHIIYFNLDAPAARTHTRPLRYACTAPHNAFAPCGGFRALGLECVRTPLRAAIARSAAIDKLSTSQ